ncbi:acyl-CoA N-acyltransferase [Plectosphaerella plurivora]|uniref:Acyl-CoA N-acyltransferase n=1 Tax=Plectosphaerella plurivora TaxID=936078 RepID=A0A9P8V8X1_9PEZI|nr:acyl-CoA N-acyltransferase [Plectosphaerella plurivora]
MTTKDVAASRAPKLHNVLIRQATTEEIPAIVEFTRVARAEIFPMIDQASHEKQTARELAQFQQTYIDHPDGAFLIARVDGAIAASIAYVAYDGRFPYLDLAPTRTVEIIRLYVDPAIRRAGLASRVFVALEKTAREAGIEQLYLHTHPFLPGAATFWERHDFSVIHVDDDPVWQTIHMKLGLGAEK